MRVRMTGRLAAAALACGVLGALLAPAQPAEAFRSPDTIHIKLGEHKLIHRAAIPGMSTLFQADYQATDPTVSDCETEPVGCEIVPIELDIPQDDPDAIEAAGYILTVVVTWDPGATVDNLPEYGTFHANDLQGFLFQNPPIHDSTGADAYTARTNGTLPGTVSAVSPTSSKFDLCMANFLGVNNGYTLEIDLANLDAFDFDPGKYGNGQKPPDYVQPTFNPPAPADPQDSGFGGAGGPAVGQPSGNPPPAFAGPAPIVVPKIANGTADQALVALSKITVRTGLARKALDKVDNKVTDVTITKSSHTRVWLTMLVLPVIALGVAIALLARRRRTAPPLPAGS